MNLSELSIKRPVFAVVCSIVIIIFGAIGFSFLGVREYPAIDPPVVNVRASYVGANAEIIEQQLTEPLEKAVNGVEGVKNITSSSSQGSCNINVEFEICVDGGVNDSTVKYLNVESVVSGSYILSAPNPIKNIMHLQTSGEYAQY
jgi:multidrug efflux pump